MEWGTDGRKVCIDACAVIKLQRLERLGTELFTTSGVLAEIKDEKARAMLNTLPVELKVQEPLPEDLIYTKKFAQATGDFGFLSRNDLDIIALTVRLHKLAGGDALRDKPVALNTASEFQTVAFDWAPSKAEKAEEGQPAGAAADHAAAAAVAGAGASEADTQDATPLLDEALADVGAADVDKVSSHDGWTTLPSRRVGAAGAATSAESAAGAVAELGAKFADVCTTEDGAAELDAVAVAIAAAEEAAEAEVEAEAAPAQPEVAQAKLAAARDAAQLDGWSDGEDSEDGSSAGEWVTVENIHRFGVKVQDVQADQKDVKVTCATADYSVQNVLLQMGITPLTFDGYAVRSVKMWGLICRACHFFTRESQKVFCPKCGHDTLVRVPIVVGQDGMPTALNAGRKLRRKGTIFSIPKPTTGRGWKPIFAEDEKFIGGRDREMRRQENLHNKERQAKDIFDADNAARGWWQRSITSTGKMLNTDAPQMKAGYGRMKNPNANNYGGFKKKGGRR